MLLSPPQNRIVFWKEDSANYKLNTTTIKSVTLIIFFTLETKIRGLNEQLHFFLKKIRSPNKYIFTRVQLFHEE